MSLVLTYWEEPRIKNSPDDFDGIKTIVLKTVKQIPPLIEARPKHCTMISVERSAARTLKSGEKVWDFKEVWRGNASGPKVKSCPHCGGLL